MRTAMTDLMHKNRLGSASTALGSRDGSIILADTESDMGMFNSVDNGPKRKKRNMNRNRNP